MKRVLPLLRVQPRLRLDRAPIWGAQPFSDPFPALIFKAHGQSSSSSSSAATATVNTQGIRDSGRKFTRGSGGGISGWGRFPEGGWYCMRSPSRCRQKSRSTLDHIRSCHVREIKHDQPGWRLLALTRHWHQSLPMPHSHRIDFVHCLLVRRAQFLQLAHCRLDHALERAHGRVVGIRGPAQSRT